MTSDFDFDISCYDYFGIDITETVVAVLLVVIYFKDFLSLVFRGGSRILKWGVKMLKKIKKYKILFQYLRDKKKKEKGGSEKGGGG